MTDGQLDPTQAVPLPGPDPDATQVWQTAPQGPLGPPPGGPPGGPPRRPDQPDRRPWILVGLMAAIVAVLLLILLLQGDDDDKKDTVAGGSTTTSTVEPSTTSSTVAPTTTTTAPTTTTTSPPTTVDPADCKAAGQNEAKIGLAAETVYDAWVRDDGACAHQLMTDDAFDELFAHDGAGASWDFQGCTKEGILPPHYDCAFTYEGGATHLLGKYDDGVSFYDVQQVAD